MGHSSNCPVTCARVAGVQVAPEFAPRRRAKSAYLVGRGNVHHAIADDGRRLQALNIQGVDPLHLQILDIAGIDLVQGAMAIAA